jgi:hypothetical protein
VVAAFSQQCRLSIVQVLGYIRNAYFGIDHSSCHIDNVALGGNAALVALPVVFGVVQIGF